MRRIESNLGLVAAGAIAGVVTDALALVQRISDPRGAHAYAIDHQDCFQEITAP
ncbi:hypothetical protein [Nodosilinea nodulosa]|uniref:hypothetical protein n=1 Tax=Nodosilinea nodulosa TaxID=416001 RepID=UPI000309AC46|nr:hypothetical protein [Nodosilinea nodulosa]